MSLAKDIRFDDLENDLLIDSSTGDFLISESDTRHVDDIIESFPGWWKESPTVGVGINRNLAQSNLRLVLSREIVVQLSADDYTVDEVEFDENFEVFITGNRNNVNL